MPQHDRLVCGIDYEDSCSRCRIGFLWARDRRGEIPIVDLLAWKNDPRQHGIIAQELEEIESILKENEKKRRRMLDQEESENLQRKRREQWQRAKRR